MAIDSWRVLLAEPAVADPPRRTLVDLLLAGAVVVGSAVQLAVDPDVPWPAAAALMALVLAPSILWRRSHPLLVVSVSFVLAAAVAVGAAIAGVEAVGLYSQAGVLVLLYALARWASGRDVVVGVSVAVGTWLVSIVAAWTDVGEAVGGLVFLLLPVAVGQTVRARRISRERTLDAVRLREREELARELHDTVAHHVSAIAIQAQAGRAVAPTRPQAAVEALEVIEESAGRTLDDMRRLVGTLRRHDETAPLTPTPGVGDLDALATTSPVDGAHLDLRVERVGPLDEVSPAVDAALYRIVQESVTNARRHARDATCVTVRLVATGDTVEVTVVDDGRPSRPETPTTGYGVVGMRERAELLGGSLDAGPGDDGRWRVAATLPIGEPVR